MVAKPETRKGGAIKDFLAQQTQGMRAMANCGVIGLHLVSGPAVGFGIGYALDLWFATTPVCGLIFLFVGIGAGFLNVYRDTRELIHKINGDSVSAKTAPKNGKF